MVALRYVRECEYRKSARRPSRCGGTVRYIWELPYYDTRTRGQRMAMSACTTLAPPAPPDKDPGKQVHLADFAIAGMLLAVALVICLAVLHVRHRRLVRDRLRLLRKSRLRYLIDSSEAIPWKLDDGQDFHLFLSHAWQVGMPMTRNSFYKPVCTDRLTHPYTAAEWPRSDAQREGRVVRRQQVCEPTCMQNFPGVRSTRFELLESGWSRHKAASTHEPDISMRTCSGMKIWKAFTFAGLPLCSQYRRFRGGGWHGIR